MVLVIILSDECKKLIDLANESVKDNPIKAVEFFKQAAQCFAIENNIKQRNTYFEKAAKMLQSAAKSNVDPVLALSYYEQSSSIYIDIY